MAREHRELQTSHSPLLSQPEATVMIKLDAIAALTKGAARDDSALSESRDSVIAVPKAKSWQPLTCLGFRIPLAFGHVIGRWIILFGPSEKAVEVQIRVT